MTTTSNNEAYTRKTKSPPPPPLPNRMVVLLMEARWIVFAALSLCLILVLLTYSKADPGWSQSSVVPKIHNIGGKFGAWLADVLLYVFGLSTWWWCVAGLRHVWRAYRTLAQRFVVSSEPGLALARSELLVPKFGFALLICGSMGLEYLRLHSIALPLPLAPGGVLGDLIGRSVSGALGFTGATLVLLLVMALGVSLYFQVSWLTIAEKIGTFIETVFLFVQDKYASAEDRRAGQTAAVKREEVVVQERAKIVEAAPVRIEPQVVAVQRSERVEKEKQVSLFNDLPDTNLPPISLLDEAPPAQETVSVQTLEFTSRLIEKKLSDFGVDAKVVAAYPGPVVTRYEIEPATGVKGSQVVNLARDLARSLSLTSIRVVETIPGKNYMGLELPNPKRQIVRLTEILGSKVYHDSTSSLTIALGKDIAGNPVTADLAKMPHLLVAGTTGSGKSVGINATILSLLYKSDPHDVRMILIDPKMLEMSVYEGIPHLLAPVVTDMRQAAHALNWAVAEMERRYKLMSKLGVRNLAGYNVKIADAIKKEQLIPNPFSLTPDAPEPLDKLPTIVIIIDELADLMMVVGKKVEELIARIAQKARAAGIHLILATQRPSVDVITGLIKANIPTRIAFQVSSKIDSRTILDQMGAEALLGMGDMLYMPPGTGLPVRVHGAFVSDEEVHRVVQYLKSQGEPNYIEGILEGGTLEDGGSEAQSGEGGSGNEADVLYDQAVAIVLKNRRASISLVQRHLRIGYNRAARLLEQMEQSGVVSTMQSNGNREILVPVGNAE
ncbi:MULTISPECIES: DNA translocase FtsK [unclassified Undibacterium]|uniref:DNA translocase FtsK n=1 Tax=unclassified Undibacterium TaxID=2630295 RepID=UPI002AC94E03|nr:MULTISPECIES: DNA translocase FtsK 4TM domain-containing protein [unclassified Undibacterium]MEB0140361.1 DNA translocase FtsK 4TM domain-containing protein [Undibacterium sp. CCC2.1]MEB0173394.1 DNA translocase FtsK 4TM domain-containing protein [Undibacterium sp. CCC1.1]MEB0176791.1 DNA translocase FtsK 4TM domain-containing protein [Undibacterium sp. CCC3.4]MEB0216552.1 DNA translocase FtsK 4TM domain-containing protein [Undibacterium sp. 5I2]WPX43388.1 DNA translocase FtsK 4TM domain-co